MPKFMLILHESPEHFAKLSPEEMPGVVAKYRAWSDKLRAAGRVVVSDKLLDEGGKVLTVQKGRLSVVDGPFSEAKEVVGGYFMIRAASYEEAVELVRDCPHLAYGGRIEVRQTDPMGCGGE